MGLTMTLDCDIFCVYFSRDELIIGAPMYSQGLEEQSLEDRNGRVYVYSASLTTVCRC